MAAVLQESGSSALGFSSAWVEPSRELSNTEWASQKFFILSSWLKTPADYLVLVGVRCSMVDPSSPCYKRVVRTSCIAAILLFIPALIGGCGGVMCQMIGLWLQEGNFNRLGVGLEDKARPTILSLNICTFPGNWNECFGGIPESGYARMGRIVSFIEQQNPDIICLQEVFDPYFADQLGARLRERGWGLILFNVGAATFGLPSGLFVASRVAIEKAQYIDFGTGRGLARGALKLKARDFDLFVSHFSPSKSDAAPTEEEKERRLLEAQTVQKHVETKRPTLLVGDLNAQKSELQIPGMRDLYEGEDPSCTEFFTERYIARLNGRRVPQPAAGVLIDRALAACLGGKAQLVHTFKLEEEAPLTDHHALVVREIQPEISLLT